MVELLTGWPLLNHATAMCSASRQIPWCFCILGREFPDHVFMGYESADSTYSKGDPVEIEAMAKGKLGLYRTS